MKKQWILLCAMAALLLSGCGKKAPAETLPPETTGSVQPSIEYMTAQVDGIPAVLKTLSRGDTVDLAGSFDEKHYVVKLDAGYGLVEKNLVRPDTQPAFTAWTGYAYRNAEVYDNYRLSGAPVKTLAADDPVEVLEDLGWCYLVKQNGTTGYMKSASLATSPASGSESSQEAPGADGGEISMHVSGGITLLSTLAPQEGSVCGQASVLADDTQVVLGYFDRGDKIPVVPSGSAEAILTVYLDGLYAEISGDYVCREGEEEAPLWEAVSSQILSLYGDYWMLGSPIDRLNANTPMTVLYELESCYLVEVNGVTGYVAKDTIAPLEEDIPEETTPETTKATEPSPKPTTPAPTVPKQDPQATTPTKPKDEDTPTETTKPTEESKPPETTVPPETTTPPETTVPPETTTPPETTVPPETTTPPETTVPPETTLPPETTVPPETTAPPEWTPPIL